MFKRAYEVILFILGILALVEGLWVFFFHNSVRKILKEMSKKKSNLKSLGLVEIVVGIILLVLYFVFGN